MKVRVKERLRYTLRGRYGIWFHLVLGQLKTFNHLRFFFVLLRDWNMVNSKNMIISASISLQLLGLCKKLILLSSAFDFSESVSSHFFCFYGPVSSRFSFLRTRQQQGQITISFHSVFISLSLASHVQLTLSLPLKRRPFGTSQRPERRSKIFSHSIIFRTPEQSTLSLFIQACHQRKSLGISAVI